MSSLRKFLQKNKSMMSLEKILTEVLDIMQKIIAITIANSYLQSKAKELVKTFDK